VLRLRLRSRGRRLALGYAGLNTPVRAATIRAIVGGGKATDEDQQIVETDSEEDEEKKRDAFLEGCVFVRGRRRIVDVCLRTCVRACWSQAERGRAGHAAGVVPQQEEEQQKVEKVQKAQEEALEIVLVLVILLLSIVGCQAEAPRQGPQDQR
jgi:hypothetical protein